MGKDMAFTQRAPCSCPEPSRVPSFGGAEQSLLRCLNDTNATCAVSSTPATHRMFAQVCVQWSTCSSHVWQQHVHEQLLTRRRQTNHACYVNKCQRRAVARAASSTPPAHRLFAEVRMSWSTRGGHIQRQRRAWKNSPFGGAAKPATPREEAQTLRAPLLPRPRRMDRSASPPADSGGRACADGRVIINFSVEVATAGSLQNLIADNLFSVETKQQRAGKCGCGLLFQR